MGSPTSTDHWKRSRTLAQVVGEYAYLRQRTQPVVDRLMPRFDEDVQWWMGPSYTTEERRNELAILTTWVTTGAALALLPALRVAMVEPEQVRVLPEMPGTREYAAAAWQLPLPFDPLYLDFGAPSGRMPLLVQPSFWNGPPVELTGAFCFRHERYGLVLAPVRRYLTRDGQRRILPTFMVSITEPSGEPDGPLRPGMVVLDGAFQRVGHPMDDPKEPLAPSITQALVVAERIVAVVIFLLAPNVSLEEVQLRGKAAKVAARKGQNIPLVVRVQRRDTNDARAEEPGKRAFSHQFDVRGHYNHVTRGPVFDANPDRQVEVPGKGRCVRVWIPPHVRGPKDAVYVPKVRIWPKGNESPAGQ